MLIDEGDVHSVGSIAAREGPVYLNVAVTGETDKDDPGGHGKIQQSLSGASPAYRHIFLYTSEGRPAPLALRLVTLV
jgi:hypothetical protein